MISLNLVTRHLSRIIGLYFVCLCTAYANELYFFDAHVHYSEDVWQAIPPDKAIERLKMQGIQRAIVSATPADGAIKLYKHDPDLVVPFLRPYRSAADRRNWYNNPEILDYVRTQLNSFNFRGLGEFHLFGSQVDTPVMKGILEMARQKNLILLAHSNHETIDALIAAAPTLTVIWAHGGFDVDIEILSKKLDNHKNLYIELSFREGIMKDGKLTQEWRKLFARYPTRFLAGTDTYTGQRWLQLPELTGDYRRWLKQLPSDIAEAIAFKNAENITKR